MIKEIPIDAGQKQDDVSTVKRTRKDTQFKKGQSGNPAGGQAHQLYNFKRITAAAIKEIIETSSNGDMKMLKEMAMREDIPIAQRIIVKALIKADTNGDFESFNKILERAIGSIKQQLDVTSSDGSMSPPKKIDLSKFSDEELNQIQKLKEKSEC